MTIEGSGVRTKGNIERVPAEALDGCDAQRVDRGLGENQPRERWTLREQAEERFRSACQRTFVGRSARIDMGDNSATIQMGEPGAASRPLPQNAGRRGSLDDRGGEPALSHEIPPGRRIGPNSLSLGPAFGDGPIGDISGPCPLDGWEARRQSGEFAQALADVAEAHAWLEPLHQSEDVAFGVASRIPPPASGMADDQDFAFASPVLQTEFRALLPIQFPWRRGSLQHHGAMHLVAQFLDFRVVSGHVRSSRSSAGAGLNGLGLVFAPALPADREAVALQGRAERAGACDAPLAARPALAVAIALSFASHAKAQRRRREQEIWPMSRGSTPSGRQRTGGYDSRWRASRNSRGAFRSPRQFAIDSKCESERSNRFRSFVGRDGVLAS